MWMRSPIGRARRRKARTGSDVHIPFLFCRNHSRGKDIEFMRVTPSLPQRGRQPKMATPLDPQYEAFLSKNPWIKPIPRGELRRGWRKARGPIPPSIDLSERFPKGRNFYKKNLCSGRSFFLHPGAPGASPRLWDRPLAIIHTFGIGVRLPTGIACALTPLT